MSRRFKSVISGATSRDDAATVAALVTMLSGIGIDRSRIDAMISKAKRPDDAGRVVPQPGNANVAPDEDTARRSA